MAQPSRGTPGPWLHALLAATLLALLCACSPKDSTVDKLGYEELYNATMRENLKLAQLREQERKLESKGPAAAPPAEPLIPSYNPLEEVPVSITMRDESLHDVLFIVARNAGLNLVIEPGISLEENRVTISFEAAKSSDVVEFLLDAYDLAWQVRNNVLYVRRYKEQTFDTGFLNVKSTMAISAGGDIFGSIGQEGGSGDLSGNVNVHSSMGKGLEEGSLYAMLAQNVDNIIRGTSSTLGTGSSSQGDDADRSLGHYTLDPMAGTLYVKSSPKKVKAVATLLRNLQRKLARQVAIDARIMEVSLSDDFRFGIDWNFVSSRIIKGLNYYVDVSWDGTQDNPVIRIPDNSISRSGLVRGQDLPAGTSLLDATIEALSTFGGVKVISNPHVRARHGQPTLFTSGVSERYVNSITREVSAVTEGSGIPTTTYSIETATVFDGVMLGVLPYINEDGSVDIQVFPIKSTVEPGSLELVNVTEFDRISLPKVNIKNVSTSVRVRHGDTVILGGLIDKGLSNETKQLPDVGDIPILGWLFKTKTRQELVRELVIIMDIKVVG